MGEPVSKFCEAVKNRQMNRVGVTGNGKKSININRKNKKHIVHCWHYRRVWGVYAFSLFIKYSTVNFDFIFKRRSLST